MYDLILILIIKKLQQNSMSMSYAKTDDKIPKIDFGQFLNNDAQEIGSKRDYQRSRHALSSRLKGNTRLKVDNHHSNFRSTRLEQDCDFIKKPTSQNFYQSEHFNHSQQKFREMRDFDKLGLDDFLKIAIIGDNKFNEVKSKEIIKTINGTWFKDMNDQLKSSKMINSLGIKKTMANTKPLRAENPQIKQQNMFQNIQYRPPNLFPARKCNAIRTASLKSKFQTMKELQEAKSPQKQVGILKNQVLKSLIRPQSRARTCHSSRTSRAKQSFSSESKRNKVPLNNAAIAYESMHMVKGVRITLHE